MKTYHWKRNLLLLLALHLLAATAGAQQYTGMSGLIHTPTADMDSAASARIGMHYLPEAMMPDNFKFEGEKYATTSWYLSYTPFRWIEIGYTFTLMKFHKNLQRDAKTGFYSKDRYFSLKVQPVEEGRWWPSVAFGGNDVWGQHDGESGSFYFRNFYGALSKHFETRPVTIGAHVAYRHWSKDYNDRWQGVVGGLTVQPTRFKPLRLIGEYDGHSVNVGADCELFRCLLLQASLQEGRHFAGGACLRVNLK